jgi:hypothetical protein
MPPAVARSVASAARGLLALPIAFGTVALPVAHAGSTHPYYRARPPAHDLQESDFRKVAGIDLDAIDLLKAHVDPFPGDPGDLEQYNRRWDARAAAIIRRAIAGGDGSGNFLDLVDKAGRRSILRGRALAAMAYRHFFPATTLSPEAGVIEAIGIAEPGWAGTFGPPPGWTLVSPPRTTGTLEALAAVEGNYDMNQMYLIPIAYRFYDDLPADARERLIWTLLGRGRVERPNRPLTITSGGTPDDWARAGYTNVGVDPITRHATKKDIGETENHILMILTARYLTNQLLFQREPDVRHDNRRNGGDGRPHTTDVILSLLRNILRGDFSEYNAKNYQTETRFALLNLATYAYESEVRLAARMVLDYISARYAVTSNDLRRMLPFRRRNEPPKVMILGEPSVAACPRGNPLDGCDPGPSGPPPYPGIMDIGLLDWELGADPLAGNFALQAGNTRAFEHPNRRCRRPNDKDACKQAKVRSEPWTIMHDGVELSIEALTDYRLPPSIHDLIVNDRHRRFYQHLHRVRRPEEPGGNRNCDSHEFSAGSPSYLITAGGTPCDYAIDPRFAGMMLGVKGIAMGDVRQQKGVAVTTSFMPTGMSLGFPVQSSSDLIQFSMASEDREGVANYGVAPDLAFGHAMYLPKWVSAVSGPLPQRGFVFVNRGAPGEDKPGFYLAIFHDHGFGLLEAFDTWRERRLSFAEFKAGVLARNRGFGLQSNVEIEYHTQNGTSVRLVVWNNGERLGVENGAQVVGVRYGTGDPNDAIGDVANTDNFLNGTILNSPREAVVEISNPALGTKIVLDLSDKWNPSRTDENGKVERGGSNHEVWVDFQWTHQTEGDFYRPFNSLSSAVRAVAAGGVLKITPGSIREPSPIRIAKPLTLTAPLGGVRIGRQ